jgi:vitamin B12 transporter
MHLYGQVSLQNDTILIQEVEIKGKASGPESAGFKITSLDSSLIGNYSHQSVADLISENSGIYIKTYGSGGLSTASLRGTGSGHTQVAWNKINLNSPMVGQFDMSLVPAGLIDEIDILYGGGSMNIGSGGFGGIVDLETKADWRDKHMVYLDAGIGSFGRYSGLIKIKTGTQGFQSVTKAFFMNAENDFRYLNSFSGADPYWETRENSQVRQKGFIQEFYLKNAHSTYSARFWYQKASRILPVPVITQAMNPPENQDDESLRAMVTYESSMRAADLNITGAFISDKLDYNNEIAGVTSRNHSKRILLKSELENRIGEIWKVRFAVSNDFNIVNTNNYEAEKTRNVLSADAIAQAEITNWITTRFLIREILLDNKLLPLDFSASTEIKPFRQKYYLIKASYSRNSKIPTLNDMYWSPGGNPDLKNESGYLSEITMEMTNILTGSFRIKNDLTFFRNHLSNMIQWHPGEFSYWEADNLGNVVTAGLETGFDISYAISGFIFSLNAGYTYTKATYSDLNVDKASLTGKQLIYIPENQINALLRMNWRHFYSIFNSGFTGKRFLNPDNSQYLPAYSVCDLRIGLKLTAGNLFCDAGFAIENLFDINYQNIAYYPMPGRNFLLTIMFQLKK